MNRNLAYPLSLLTSLVFMASPILAANVELHVVASSRAPFNAAQQWAIELAKLKSINVRAGNGRNARPEVTRSAALVRITGVIDGRNRLVVPGRSFTMRQTPSLQKWIDDQRDGKAAGGKSANADRFGLTSKQLEDTHEALKAKVATSTKGEAVRDVVERSARAAGLRLQLSASLRRRMLDQRVAAEWQGFTVGTTIAAALRPLELVMTPRNETGKIVLSIEDEVKVKEGWPVGWKSKLKPSELVPKFYEPLPINVEGVAVADVMAALEGRLATPMQYDTALLDLLDLDPKSKKVTYAAERSTYLKVVRTCLFKAGMKYEIRVDERGKPFFWVSPRRIPK